MSRFVPSRRLLGLQAGSLLLGASAARWLTEAQAQTRVPRPSTKTLRIAAGGMGSLYYLPLTAAERLGYFREEGLNVELLDFAGGALAMDALRNGDADVACGAFEQLLEQQALGFECRSLALMGRTPQMAVATSLRFWPRKALSSYRDIRIGVSSPGSSSQFFAKLWLIQEGLSPAAVEFVGLGGGVNALNAMRQGRVHALSHVDPLITLLEQNNEVRIMADTRTLKGSQDFFGGPMPGACLYAPRSFIERRASETQALANAMVHALKWMQTAGPSDLARIIPMQYWLDDRGAYLSAFEKVRETLSPDGVMPGDGPATALGALARLRTSQVAPKVNLSLSYSNEWVRRAKQKFQL